MNGVEIIAPSDVVDRENALVLICSPQPKVNAVVSKQLNDLGLKNLNVYGYFFALHSPEILDCADQLDDDESASVYSTMIGFHLKPETDLWAAMLPFTPDGYFALPPFEDMLTDEVFVDCGAYVGDTVETYLFKRTGMFGKIFAFEPDSRNFKALSARSRRLIEEWALDDGRINIVNAGVGRKTETLFVHRADSNLGHSLSNSADAGDTVNVVALDDYFLDQRISFLKADIESYELDMLKGAEKIIRRDRPKMVICIYHNAVDFYSIPLLVKEFRPDYKLMIRHHSLSFTETVLYAW